MHWVEVIADTLLSLKKKHVIASGTSISGEIHIGNAGDVIIADAIARVLVEKGCDAQVLWIMDDTDPFRKVPSNIPAEFKKYLGMPVSSLPCPQNCCSSFVQHFTKPFLDALQKVGVKPKVISSADMYKKGYYDDTIQTALNNTERIRTIFSDIARTKKPSDWLPFQSICECCGRIATTKTTGFDKNQIYYECTGGFVGNQKLEGCGHSGKTSIHDGKMPWRIEWAARWKIFGVTCEPFGKDHAAAGGSYDTSKKIVSEIFGYTPPYPVVYEHILFGGKKISKSAGLVISLSEFLNAAPPEVVRYFYFRTKSWKHKEFSMSNLIHFIEDYEATERIYFGIQPYKLEKELPDVRKAYELAQVNKIPQNVQQAPFNHLLSVVQISDKWDDILVRLQRAGYCKTLDTFWREKLMKKVECAKYWLRKYAPTDIKFSILPSLPDLKLTDDERTFVMKLHELFEKTEWSPTQIHKAVHTAAENIIDKKNAFKILYMLFIGRDKGPRMGYFLVTLEKKFVLERLRTACEML